MRPIEVKSWGVDIGNVILRGLSQNDQKLAEAMRPEDLARSAQLVPDALIGLKFLVDIVGPEDVWVVSKANRKMIEASRLAFERFDVYNTTGLRKDQVLFVPERQDKRPIIKVLELDGHIDDRGEVITAVQQFVPCPIWFAPEETDTIRWLPRIKYSVRVVSSWRQFKQLF